jgi:site-specific DNA recombinase
MTTNVLGYARTSTSDQQISLALQEAKIRAYCDLHDLTLVEVIVESASGATMARPGLQRALDMLKRGSATGLCVLKMDRLSRSVVDLASIVTLFKSGKRTLHSVIESVDTSTAMGRGVLNIFASLGQMEREQIAERTSAALQHKKTRGERVGSVPLGFTLVDGALVPDQREQAVISQARELRAAGMSLRDVACALDERGLRTRTGRPWLPAQVARMLASAA